MTANLGLTASHAVGVSECAGTPTGLQAVSPGLRVFELPWETNAMNNHLISYYDPEGVAAHAG